MLLTAFRLRRDINTERSSFGYTRAAMSKLGRISPTTPTLGCRIEPVEPSTIIKTSIVKMVEFYNRRPGAVIVERLSWSYESCLYPYKARFIKINRHDTAGDVDLLFPNNISKIHNALSGNYVSFLSPIKYHIDSMLRPWHNNHSYDEVNYLGRKYGAWIDNFAYAHDAWTETEQFMSGLMNGIHPGDLAGFEQFMVPKPPISDPFTVNNHALPIQARNLMFEKPLGAPFDVSPPIDLIINHPNKTLYSPKISQQAIDVLDQLSLQYSDLSFEYILSGTVSKDFKVNYLVSRYRNFVLQNVDIEGECRWIVIHSLEIAYHAFRNIEFLDDIRVSFIMTYGEEALIEFFNYETNECLGAIHFDLAMLSLCALSITTSVANF